jgi:selenide,water dikinase
MATLNRGAAEVAQELGVRACTDVTGFGLLGHLSELARGSGVDVSLSAGAVPTLEAAEALAAAEVVPGGSLANLEHVERTVRFAPGVSRVSQILLADAQTSGGLLISVAEDRCQRLLEALHERGVAASRRIGCVTREGTGRIDVEA